MEPMCSSCKKSIKVIKNNINNPDKNNNDHKNNNSSKPTTIHLKSTLHKSWKVPFLIYLINLIKFSYSSVPERQIQNSDQCDDSLYPIDTGKIVYTINYSMLETTLARNKFPNLS